MLPTIKNKIIIFSLSFVIAISAIVIPKFADGVRANSATVNIYRSGMLENLGTPITLIATSYMIDADDPNNYTIIDEINWQAGDGTYGGEFIMLDDGFFGIPIELNNEYILQIVVRSETGQELDRSIPYYFIKSGANINLDVSWTTE